MFLGSGTGGMPGRTSSSGGVVVGVGAVVLVLWSEFVPCLLPSLLLSPPPHAASSTPDSATITNDPRTTRSFDTRTSRLPRASTDDRRPTGWQARGLIWRQRNADYRRCMLHGRRREWADADAFLEDAYAQGWTDGLPVVPATPEKVE